MLDRKGDMVTSISTRLSTPITPVDDANLLEVDDGDARIEEIASSDHASIPSVPESTFCLSPQCGYSQWALGTRKPKPISSLRLPGSCATSRHIQEREYGDHKQGFGPPYTRDFGTQIIYTGL